MDWFIIIEHFQSLLWWPGGQFKQGAWNQGGTTADKDHKATCIWMMFLQWFLKVEAMFNDFYIYAEAGCWAAFHYVKLHPAEQLCRVDYKGNTNASVFLFSFKYNIPTIQECTIPDEMYNSTIADTMSECNNTMWDFILVSRVTSHKAKFKIWKKPKLNFRLTSDKANPKLKILWNPKPNFRVVSHFSSRAKIQRRYYLVCFSAT